MNELVIKTHDFEQAKRGLKEFSQKNSDELNIDTVRTEGGFLGLGEHKVTGDELNSRLLTIQQHLIYLNTVNDQTIKEFGQVYSALEALDKDYIQAILISIKATETTSERIQTTQEQIKKIVDDQKKTLEVLKKFKQKLDGYAHLEDIDKIWSDCQNWYNEITTLSNQLNQQQIELEETIYFTSELEKQSDKIISIIQTNKENTDLDIQMLTEKIKYAYILASGSLGLVIIMFIIIFLR